MTMKVLDNNVGDDSYIDDDSASKFTYTGNQLGAIDEGQSLLGLQADGGEVVALQDVLGIAPAGGGAPHLALAHEAEGEVGEGRQVPARPHRALLRHPGQARGVEGVNVLPENDQGWSTLVGLLEGLEGDAGVALGQHVDPEGQQHPEE